MVHEIGQHIAETTALLKACNDGLADVNRRMAALQRQQIAVTNKLTAANLMLDNALDAMRKIVELSESGDKA